MDLWLAHLHPQWATAQHIDLAPELLRKNRLQLASLAGGVGDWDELESLLRMAQKLGSPVIAGLSPLLEENRSRFLALLAEYQITWAWENHPEKDAASVQDLIKEDQALMAPLTRAGG